MDARYNRKEGAQHMSPLRNRNYLTMQQFMDVAIQFEVESAEYYHQMATMVSDGEIVELLARLEEQEREHERILKAYNAPDEVATTFQFAPELATAMPSPSENPDFSEMLSVAIARERKAADIYRAASLRTVGAFREMIEGLAGFEEEHEARLRLLQDSRG